MNEDQKLIARMAAIVAPTIGGNRGEVPAHAVQMAREIMVQVRRQMFMPDGEQIEAQRPHAVTPPAGAVPLPDAAGDRMLRFFEFAHLPEPLRQISQPFGELAKHLVESLPAGPERTVALRKLLESKDCAVRAKLEAQRP